MDSVLYLAGCVGFAWLVLWSLRDFDKPSTWFWPFDARWMRRPQDPAPDTATEPQRGATEPVGRWARRPAVHWRRHP